MQVTWDAWAVPTITGDSDLDVVRGIGHAQAVAHAGLILELYGLARGTAAAQWGSDFLKEDTFTAELGLRAVTETWYLAQMAETLERLQAFCDGFNLACAQDETRGAARRAILPVTPRDVVAHFVRDLVRFNQIDPNQLAFAPADFFGVDAPAGSNAWAVAGSKSSSGGAMLMINPHLSYLVPFHRFMEFRAESPGWRFHGITLIGMPWPSMGYNGHIGWANTVNPIRNLLVYELDLDEDSYAWDGSRRKLERIEHVIDVLGQDSMTVVERRSLHGPVVTAPDGAQVAVRIAGVMDHPATTALESSWLLSRVLSVQELLETHDQHWLPMFNIVAADSAGSIAALFCGTPWKRTRGTLDDSQRRLPGDDPSWLFDEVHPASEMPRVVDPPSGFVQNCNEPPWLFTSPVLNEEDWPAHIAPRADQLPDLRARVSHRFMAEHETVSPAELLALKYAEHAVLADICLPQLIGDASDAPDLYRAGAVLQAWDRKVTADSVGYPLFWLWAMLSAPAMVLPGFFTPVDHPAAVPARISDPVASVEVLRAAVKTFGTMGLPLDAVMADVASFGTDDEGAPVPLSGGAGALGVLKVMQVLPTPTGPLVSLGDTWICRVEFPADGPPVADSLLVYGNTTEPGAPPSRSQYTLWAANQLRPRDGA